jgi:metallo-beta-lactamase family protein
MRISFHGAAQTVTGSQHLLQVNGHQLLLECGLFQGSRQEAYQRNRNFPYAPAGVEAMILSHAHIDHSGNLPNLVKKGYRGPIYATPATAHLSNLMLLDSGSIHESDAEYLNKKRSRRGEPPIEPLYTVEDAARVAPNFQGVDYGRPFQVLPGVTARLVEAGHILGSAAVVLDIEEQGRPTRLWFSGDIGRRRLPLLRDPVMPDGGTDILIMECTYGDRLHLDPGVSYTELRSAVSATIQRKGKMIVPAFAIGRTQELVYYLHQMIDRNEIPPIPVVVDSPLAVNATEIFGAHPEVLDQEALAFQQADVHHSALGFGLVTYVRSVEQSKQLNNLEGPMVIISASGMAETGRILHHLKNNIEDPRNTILIVSWQAPETLGRRLADGARQVKIFGETYHRRANVVKIDGLSAHADQAYLTEYALAAGERLQQIFLVHGEAASAQVLTEKLAGTGLARLSYPTLHSTIDV